MRDALRILTGEGLLETRKRGFFVKGFSQADIDELYDIRQAAEQLACALALGRTSASGWAGASHWVDVMQATAQTGDQHAYAKADLAFHTEFYVLSGNARLLSLWRQFQPTFATLLDLTNSSDADLRPSAHDHRALLELAQKPDAAGFAHALDAHLAGSRRRMSALVAGRPALVGAS